MFRSRMFRLGLAGTGLVLGLAAFQQTAAAQDTASPAFGKQIDAAKAAIGKGNYAEASRNIEAAASLRDNNAYEKFVVEQMRGYLALRTNDYPAAISAFTAEINSGRLSGADKQSLTEAVAGLEFSDKNYAQAAQWTDRYYKDGGSDPKLKEMQIQSHYLSNDYATAARLQQARIKQQIATHQTPTKDEFDLLYSCYLNLKNQDGVIATLKQAVIYYPQTSYWQTLINNVINADNFDTDRLEYDAGLLSQATKSVASTSDYMNLVQVALQGDHAGMAMQLYNDATSADMFGKGSQGDVGRQQRLHNLIVKTMSDDTAREPSDMKFAQTDPNQAVAVGYNLVSLGKADQGIALMEKGIAAGASLPNIAKLRLGEAYVETGRIDDAKAEFAMVEGGTGTKALAELWLLHLNQKS